MADIYLIAAHTSFSPGCVGQGRTEHGDCLRFVKFLACILRRESSHNVRILTGNVRSIPERDAYVLVFHRSSNMKNESSSGAKVFVSPEADCSLQYDAYRLLDGICRKDLFRYKGVHNSGILSKEAEGSSCRNTYVLTLGFFESAYDNKLLDERIWDTAKGLSDSLTEIIKERENDNNT